MAGLALHPAEEEGDGAGVVAQAVTGLAEHPELDGVAGGVGQHPGVLEGDRLVVGPVDQQDRAGGILATRAVGRISRSSRAQASGSGGKERSRITPTARARARKSSGSAAQSLKSARAENVATPRTRSSSPA